MAKTKSQKQEMLAQYKKAIAGAGGVLVVNPTGITPNIINEFKRKLSDLGGEYHVVKNTIFKIALKESEQPELETLEAGSNAVIFAGQDIAATAKLLKAFIKDNAEKVEIAAGIYEGQALSAAQVADLADLPTKEQSVAMIAGLINQSLGGVVNVLEDSIRSIAIIINLAYEGK